MTFDERAEILRWSIESRDRWLAKTRDEWKNTQAEIRELNQTAKASRQRIDALNERVDRFAQTTQRNFDRLTNAMMLLGPLGRSPEPPGGFGT
jgi:septal ring factor EnvC (AmiA/AmiB activator)